jgi:putative membrane protein
MKSKSKFFNFLLLLIQGAIVGIGAILPGVSGGVLCVVFGMYEPMMELLTSPKQSFKKHYKIFAPFALGWLVGFVLLAKFVGVFLESHTDIALMLFYGLILGTIPELMKKSQDSDEKMSWTPMVVSLAVSFFIFHLFTILDAIQVELNVFSYLFCGFLWGLSLIIPGLSSSSILLFLGIEQSMLEGVGNLDLSVIIPYLLGIVITVLLLARLVNMLFKKHYALISRIMLGFIISSALVILPKKFDSLVTFAISMVCFVGGFILARVMDIMENKNKQ